MKYFSKILIYEQWYIKVWGDTQVQQEDLKANADGAVLETLHEQDWKKETRRFVYEV